MLLTVDRVLLEELFKHAASAAHLVGHLDDGVPDAVIGAIADDIDAIAHGLGELLGPRPVVGHTSIAGPDDRVSRGGARVLVSGGRGAR